jgi:hypothetical protein
MVDLVRCVSKSGKKKLALRREQTEGGRKRPQRQKQALERGGVTSENAKEKNVLRLEI